MKEIVKWNQRQNTNCCSIPSSQFKLKSFTIITMKVTQKTEEQMANGLCVLQLLDKGFIKYFLFPPAESFRVTTF